LPDYCPPDIPDKLNPGRLHIWQSLLAIEKQQFEISKSFLRDFAGDGVETRQRRSTGRAGMNKPRDKNNSKLSL